MDQNKKTLVAVVIFPLAKKFLKDCFKGLNNQVDKDFNILIVEDGITFPFEFSNINVYKISSNGASPIQNREQIIRYAIENNYENLIFIDCDDIALPNRVGFIKKYLKNCDAVIHDMQIINDKNELIKNFMFKDAIEYIGQITPSLFFHKNFSGLGNTGYKVEKLYTSLPLPADFPAVDWWLIMNILLNGGMVEYKADVLTSYRQYGGNTANVLTYKKKDIVIEYLIKQKLYCNLLIKYPRQKDITKELKVLNRRFESLINQDLKLNCTRTVTIWWNLLNELEKEK